MITFRKGGATLEEMAEAEKLGIRYKKYQKKALLAAAAITSASAEEIARFEQEVGELPPDYKAFLATCNGGIPSRTSLSPSLHITSFFSLTPLNLHESLHHQHRLLGLPHWLPIAENAAGDKYLLRLSGHQRFSVHFYRHDAAENDSDAFQSVADSFSDLLTKLDPS
ncbi:MAG: SMI1/KNR4 family protein [Pseudomonadota bacterium]|nr:SMI1/KNR4 family protein [Pseudomonadota bacterium]